MKLNRVQYKSFSGLFDDSEEERLFAKFPGRKAAMIGRRSGGSNFRSTNRTLNKPTGGSTKPPAKPVSPAQPKQNPTYTLTGGSGNGSSTFYVGGTSTSTGNGTIQYPYYGGGSFSTPLKSTGGGGGYAGSAGLGNNGGTKSPITGGPASDFAAASTKTGTGSGQGGYAAMAGQGKSPMSGSGPASDFVAASAKTGTGQGNTGGGVDPNYRYTSTTSTTDSGLSYTAAPQTPAGGRKSLRDITAQRNQQQQSQVKQPNNPTVDPAAAAAGKQRRQATNERKRVARQSYDAGYQKGMNSANEQISQMQSQLDATNNAVTEAQNNTGVSQGLQNTWNNAGFMTKAGMLGATGAGLYFLGKGVMDTVDDNGQDRQRY